MAGIVWVTRKIRHLIETSKYPTTFYTDHGAALGIAKQTTLSTSSTDKLNLRLICASDYIQRFNITLRHKPGKMHIVPDALSRLSTSNSEDKLGAEGELDVLFTTALVEMSNEFRTKILKGYETDPAWQKLAKTLDTEDDTRLLFRRKDGLIYWLEGYASSDHALVPRRLCIPSTAVKDILSTAHNDNHGGFARCYERIASAYYIKNLSRHLRKYLKHCPACQINQTRRHKPYGKLQPILSPPISFHTITLDFVLALPKSKSGLDCLKSVTDKFSKRVTIIPGKSNWTAMEWAEALLHRLDIADWGLPKVIISDRDPKFLSDLWRALFTKLGVNLLYLSAYHPQTDGQSERTNQTVKIALQFLLPTLENPSDWPSLVGPIQRYINNSLSAATGKSPNEVVYGFTPTRSKDLAKPSNLTMLPKLARIEVADAIAFAQANAARAYDKKHQAIRLEKRDYALLRLHKGYNIPSGTILGRKLSQQYAGPFRIIDKIDNLAYKLDLSQHWRIHLVFTIAQLEPCPSPSTDPFKQPYPEQPNSIFVEGDTEQIKSYEVEKLIAHRDTKRRGKKYLLCWKGYGPEFDKWRNTAELGDSMDLLHDYQQQQASHIPAASPSQSLPFTTGRNQPLKNTSPDQPASSSDKTIVLRKSNRQQKPTAKPTRDT